MNWRKVAVDVATVVGPPAAVAAAGHLLAQTYGGTPQVAEWIVALVAGIVAIRSREQAIKWGALAVFLACLQASVVGMFGFDLAGITAIGLAMAACAAARINHNIAKRRTGYKSQIELARLQNVQARTAVVYKRLDKLNEQPFEPDLQGRNDTETELRRAVWSTFKTELAGCDAHPTEFGWEARIQCPPELARERVGRDWARVASALGVPGNFEIRDGHNSNELVVRYLEQDPLQEPIPYRSQPEAQSFRDLLRLGSDGVGGECLVDPAYFHWLIAGSSKYGKSGLVKLVMLRLAERADSCLIGVDMKPGAPEFTGMKPILQDLAQTVDQARGLFSWLMEEMRQRGEILAAAGDTLWDPRKHGRPALFVVVDELAELVRQGDDVGRGEEKVSKQIESALALARAYAIHLILATQQPSNRVFGKSTDARGNLSIRVSVRMNDPKHRQFVFGGGGWHPGDLDLPGKFLIQSPDHGQPWPYRAEWVSDEIGFTETQRLGRDLVRPGPGNRLILPADQRLGNQERVLERLGHYGPMSRQELELATGLEKANVLRALQSAKGRVERDDVAGQNLWRLVT